MGDVTPQHHLKPGQAVVAQRAADENFVLIVQRGNLNVVVQHDTPEGRERGSTWVWARDGVGTDGRLSASRLEDSRSKMRPEIHIKTL